MEVGVGVNSNMRQWAGDSAVGQNQNIAFI